MMLLLGVLALAYVGSMFARGRALRGYGLPSGTEWLLLGIAIGPHAFGLIDSKGIKAFEPVALMGIGWLSFVIGASIARRLVRDEHSSEPRNLGAAFIGLALASATAAAVFAAVSFVARSTRAFSEREVWLLAAGVALVSCETTRYAVSWVITRYEARGPLSSLVAGLSDADDLVPLLALAVPFAWLAPEQAQSFGAFAWMLAPLALGTVLGTTAALLLRFEADVVQGLGVLLGAALLCVGLSSRLSVAPPASMFALGFSLVLLSRHRRQIAELLHRTEHAVVLPLLLIAGASTPLALHRTAVFVIAAACATRLLARLLAAPLLGLTRAASNAPRVRLALGLLSTGGLTIAIGLMCSLRFPEPIAEIVLAAAVCQAVLGELLGPGSLRRALVHVGEIEPDKVQSDRPAQASRAASRTEEPSA